MPYITQVERDFLDKGGDPSTPGDLTYVIYRACIRYIDRRAKTSYEGRLRFAYIAEVLGALSAASQEFYRRIASPFEDHKIIENGDVS
jgi:hypothetical protein